MAGVPENSNVKNLRSRSKRIPTSQNVKSRRKIIFKQKRPFKCPYAISTPVTSEMLYYKGSYFTVGDVVSVVDDKYKVYYAQIRGLLQDQYCEKSAVLTWLLPTVCSPKGRFDPATYILGPEEEIPRKLEFMQFVCHAPSDYYRAINSPYPTLSFKPESGYIWTRLGPRIVTLPYKEDKLSDLD